LIEESGSNAGRAVANGARDHLERLRSLFDAFNELVRTEGDVLAWEREWFDPRAEYRPIEDRDWFRDPEGIARSISRWVETWAGSHRIEPKEILELGQGRFLVTAHNHGVGRHSGVPIEATTYMAVSWRGGKIVWFDEYFDKEAAMAALREPVKERGPGAQVTLAGRAWRLSESAFAALVRRCNDRQLERLFGSGRAQRAIFKRMEGLFDPAKARGFTGEIQYELLGSDGVKHWVLRIDGDRATTRAGEARMPVTTLRTRLSVFVRMAARELHPLAAYRDGLLEVTGNFDVATRIEAMFGLSAKQPPRG
jgi:ketosteroid isomerase-like protein